MPAIKTYFVQACPVCGRTLQVPIELLGETAHCRHCMASFRARDTTCNHIAESDPRTLLMQRVDALLDDRRTGVLAGDRLMSMQPDLLGWRNPPCENSGHDDVRNWFMQ